MVQETSLEDEDYLLPLGTLYDTLLNPEHQTKLTPSTLNALLIHHLDKLRAPYKPYGSPSNSSRQALKAATVNIPHTSVALDVTEKSRKLAYQLSERADIDELEALILIKTCDDEVTLDRATLWFAEEALAIPKLVMALQRLSRGNEGEWTRIASEVLGHVVTDEEKYIEGLFRAWATVAQKQLEGKQRSDEPLFWARFQLRVQNELLDMMFLSLYQLFDRSAIISQGLVTGIVSSAFGTAQANREIWNTDSEAQRLQQRIQDLTLVIALEALCLSGIVSPPDTTDPPATLLHNRDALGNLDRLLSTESQHLSSSYSEPELSTVGLTELPMPVLCLAWSIVLRSLPEELLPSSLGYERPGFEEFASRALVLSSRLFQWMEQIMTGPLFAYDPDAEEDGVLREAAIWRRKVVKDLLVGLSELVQLHNIPDRDGLYHTWDLTFGGGSPSTSATLCEDFWEADYRYESRSAILDRSLFPYNATESPQLLTALSGAKPRPVAGQDREKSPAITVFEYIGNLPSLTFQVDPQLCAFTADDDDRQTVTAKKDLILPGMLKIRAGTSGEVISIDDGKNLVIRWTGPFAAWGLLVEIARAVSGLRSLDQRDGFTPDDADFVNFSIQDLGISSGSRETLSAMLDLLRATMDPILGLQDSLCSQIRFGEQPPRVLLLELAINTLSRHLAEQSIARSCLDIVRSLLFDPSPAVWNSLSHSPFFGRGRRQGVVAQLIEVDSSGSEHTLTISVLELISTMAANLQSTAQTDENSIKSALQLVINSVWLPSSGWRFKTIASRYRIISQLATIFTSILRHAAKSSLPAQFLIEAFITSSSLLTYRPLLEVLSRAPTLATKLISSYRTTDALSVVETIDKCLNLLSVNLRLAVSTGNSLLSNLFAAPIMSNDRKVQVIEVLFELATSPILPTNTRLCALSTIQTYLEATVTHAPPLVGLLQDAKVSFASLCELGRDESADIRIAVFNVLRSALNCQPGCAPFCTSSKELDGPLAIAVDHVIDWQSRIDNPQTISSALAYCNAVVACPGASKAVDALKTRHDFWTATFNLATRTIPSPPTFTLSMHSDDFAARIRSYSYAVQAKAEAITLLASQLALELEEDVESKARSSVLGLFRNTSALTEISMSAIHNSCIPRLHETQGEAIKSAGLDLATLKTLYLPAERAYGPSYVYDGEPRIPGDITRQSQVNLALDMLNLNWSMLEADLSLTRALTRLTEVVYTWTEGDTLAAAASLRAGASVAEVLASEDQGGDVMLAIQCERLTLLSKLLDTALGSEPDKRVVTTLIASVKEILDSHVFPATIGLRHPELSPIHRPLLRIVHAVVQSQDAQPTSLIEGIVEAATAFTLDAADTVVDGLIRESTPDLSLSSDFEQIVGIICELTRTPFTTLWLDKVSEHNLIPRSLEIVSRMRPVDDIISPHVASALLLHMALASNPLSAEKLALSGLLPTYADNAIATRAEQADVTPTSTSRQAHTVHGAWCSMLCVVHAILVALPPTTAGTFARSDVIPFFRVCEAQLLHSLSWNGETSLSIPILDELNEVTNLIHALVLVTGPTDALFELSVPMTEFLKSVRYALLHPRMLSLLMVPSEEVAAELTKEIEAIGDEEPTLVDFTRAPICAGRVVMLLEAARSVVMALVLLTNGWEVCQSDTDELDDLVLCYENEAQTAAEDPVGVLNDILSQMTRIIDTLPLSTTDPKILHARSILTQLQESSALLSTSQLILRSSGQTDTRDEDMDMDRDSNFEKSNARRRASLMNMGPADRAGHILGELTRDLVGILNAHEGSDGLRPWLSKVADRRLLTR